MLGQSCTNALALWSGEALALANLEQDLRGTPRQSKKAKSKGKTAGEGPAPGS